MLVSPCSWRCHSSCSSKKRYTKRYAVSVDVKGSTDEEPTSVNAVEQVPLPQAFPEDGVSIVPSLPPVTSLDDLPELRESTAGHEIEDGPASGCGIELDKNQSLWLLNLVAFLYGTNTTVRCCTSLNALPGCLGALPRLIK